MFEEELKAIQPGISDKEIEKKRLAEFAPWLKNKVSRSSKFVLHKNVIYMVFEIIHFVAVSWRR
ncbi:hypothetical protein ABFV55_27705, partial [Pseudomonas syringae]|uniref:hypothetical protein n=1 Tax=Pseudomonas syringae TaxID=317 RepID=UPI0034D9711D